MQLAQMQYPKLAPRPYPRTSHRTKIQVLLAAIILISVVGMTALLIILGGTKVQKIVPLFETSLHHTTVGNSSTIFRLRVPNTRQTDAILPHRQHRHTKGLPISTSPTNLDTIDCRCALALLKLAQGAKLLRADTIYTVHYRTWGTQCSSLRVVTRQLPGADFLLQRAGTLQSFQLVTKVGPFKDYRFPKDVSLLGRCLHSQ